MKVHRVMVAFLLLMIVGGGFFYKFGRSYWYPVYTKIVGESSVVDVVERYKDSALERITSDFKSAKMSFPPKELAFLAIKESNDFELWARNEVQWKRIKNYQIKAASGVLGPKLREGDRQVPEGIYKVSWLNPNSSYHLSLKLNYPNEFDLKWAQKESRLEPGTNIFIHGKAVSIGCLAMGDPAIEELFLLTELVGKEKISVIISPVDPRLKTLINPHADKQWVDALYRDINDAFLSITESGDSS